jgi:Lrp/AsnC family transcriptional regulator, leucine-responsive regulatory protein
MGLPARTGDFKGPCAKILATLKEKPHVRLQGSNDLLDDKNLELLRLLQSDPRQPVSALARRIGMSAPAVRERLTRLEEGGVIRGYRIDIDPKALGLPIAAVIRVRPSPGQLQRVADLAREIPNVTECHRITGEDCLLLKVHLAAIDDLDHVIDRFLAYGTTTTSIIQSSPVPLRTPPLPDDARFAASGAHRNGRNATGRRIES